MKSLFCFLFIASSSLFAVHTDAAVLLIGHFTNQKISYGEDPHFLSGFNLSLYREGSNIFGNISMANGSPEPVRGALTELAYDPIRHSISFKAKFSTGMEFSKETGPEGRQSREVIIFSGKVYPHSVKGTLVQKSGYSGKITNRTANMAMKRYDFDYVPASYKEWKSQLGVREPW